jgi:hypothetical protein
MMAQFGFADFFHVPCDALEEAPPGPAWKPEPQERDELAALLEAVPDLNKVARYERRAWSRRKRALREFINIKVRTGALKAGERSQPASCMALDRIQPQGRQGLNSKY